MEHDSQPAICEFDRSVKILPCSVCHPGCLRAIQKLRRPFLTALVPFLSPKLSRFRTLLFVSSLIKIFACPPNSKALHPRCSSQSRLVSLFLLSDLSLQIPPSLLLKCLDGVPASTMLLADLKKINGRIK